MVSRRKTANRDLPPLPSYAEIARAIRDAPDRDPRAARGITANILAQHLGVQGARRAGRGAVQHSWSGTMSGSLRIAPRLRAMQREGLVFIVNDRQNYRMNVELTEAGRSLAEDQS